MSRWSGRVASVAAVLAVMLFAVPALAMCLTCSKCHKGQYLAYGASAHNGIDCDSCHEGADAHATDPTKRVAVHFDLDLCGKCHKDQYGTYVYGDDYATRFGGSAPHKAKTDTFPHYNDIIDGHGFTKEYNNRRGHNVMLLDHFDIKRGKFDTCLQCKSTKLAYYWNSGKERTVENDVTVKAGHMKEAIVVPKGTKVKMSTEEELPYPKTHEVHVLITLPDGKQYSSYDVPGATKDPAWTWAVLYALTVDGLEKGSGTFNSGNGCNHCHDPHNVGKTADGKTTGFRLVRKAEITAIAKDGMNPYNKDSEKEFNGSAPLSVDSSSALCGQCHVNYVCGVSSIDKVDRDFFPWVKADKLEALNHKVFPGYGQYSTLKHIQDWKHGTGPLSSPNSPANGVKYNTPHPIGEVLTKSRHPEVEVYWDSPHYQYGARCDTCHMPKVTKTDGTKFTSHWLTSPYKYMEEGAVGPFSKKFDIKLDKNGAVAVCDTCHEGESLARKAKAEKIQDEVYKQALEVQDALVASLASIEAAKKAKAAGKPVDAAAIKAAVEDHREAHVRWENLVVSENSMGFHNPPEVKKMLADALDYAKSAKKKADDAVAAAEKTAAK